MDTYDKTTPRRRRRLPKAVATGLGLLGLGATAGAVASTAVSANAATTTTAAPASSSTTAPSGASTTAPSGASTTAPSGASTTGPSGASSMAPPRGGAGLPLSGTVTAVGSSDVTIETSAATTTYAVTSTSDIDKNGEATLSDLAVGDAVTFSTVPSNGTTAIDRLHAGNEQLDMPGPGATPTGGPAAATSGSTSSA